MWSSGRGGDGAHRPPWELFRLTAPFVLITLQTRIIGVDRPLSAAVAPARSNDYYVPADVDDPHSQAESLTSVRQPPDNAGR
jgi:hypothetical protein